jgi:hypothetical protein
MQILKWFLIVLCVVALLLGGGLWAGMHFWNSTPAIALTRSDISKGGPNLPGERTAFIEACRGKYQNSLGSNAGKACECLASFVDKELSRYERLTIAASFSYDLRQIVHLNKGLFAAKLAPKEIDALSQTHDATIDAEMKRCGQE